LLISSAYLLTQHATTETSEAAPELKAAAAMSVQVGSFADPLECEGLAHFLEHMVFMVSEKYPKENEYDVFGAIEFRNGLTLGAPKKTVSSLFNSSKQEETPPVCLLNTLLFAVFLLVLLLVKSTIVFYWCWLKHGSTLVWPSSSCFRTPHEDRTQQCADSVSVFWRSRAMPTWGIPVVAVLSVLLASVLHFWIDLPIQERLKRKH
jgi:hypothetical protein